MIEMPQLARTAILKIIDEEGGWIYTNHPVDPDRGTYTGIRYKVFRDYYSAHVAPEKTIITPMIYKDLAKQGTIKDIIIDIYYNDYYKPLRVDKIIDTMKMPLFSAGVNMGQRRASIILQRSINLFGLGDQSVKVDGYIGPKTIAVLDQVMYASLKNTQHITSELTMETKLTVTVNMDRFRNLFVKNWCQRYVNIVIDDPDDIVFLNGWFNRANNYWIY